VVADAFYEYYHENGATHLYEIRMKSEEPVLLAGIYDTWTFIETGEIHQSATIVTTKANEMMKGIHNNPKADESRMPVILKNDNLMKWMDNTIHHNHHLILKELFVPFDQELLEAHEVPKPKKAGI
jgi:putative SOS response-associated peptidase YedK